LQVALVALITGLVYLLHQDFWFWRSARPLVFGFLPIGLFYHAAYTVAVSLLMWYIVRRHWPAHLEEPGQDEP
jgi:predicted exporter